MPSWKTIRTKLSDRPKTTAGIAGISSLFIFLIPTLVNLIPLDKKKKNALSERNNAQYDFDNTATALVVAKEQIREAGQRIIDLDCAMQGYQGFNQAIAAFQKSITDSTATPSERLATFWKMHFDPDRNENSRSVEGKSWTELEYRYDYYYSCAHSCGKDRNCCYGWGYHWVPQTYYYNEITSIAENFKNIIQGSPFKSAVLDCGYYSREFRTAQPETYLTYESPHVQSGRREAGSTYIDFYREYGSRVTVSYLLDEVTTNNQIVIFRNTDQSSAATELAQNLFQFLSLSIAAFNMAGANYSDMQTAIRNNIPNLITTAAAINNTLNEKALVLASKETIFSEIDDDYKTGLSLWLPIFWLVPGGIALFVYLVVTKCFNYAAEDEIPERNVDIENPVSSASYKKDSDVPEQKESEKPDKEKMRPPAYSPASFYSKNKAALTDEQPPPSYEATMALK